MGTEAAKGTSSGGGAGLVADLAELGRGSAEALNLSGELHSLELLLVVVEAAEEKGTKAATAAAICEGDLNMDMGSIKGLL